MSHAYRATVEWRRGDAVFSDGRYSRFHHWGFDDGVIVPASSSPDTVRPPLSRTDAVDPEEAVVAAVSSCHMLFFLDFARKASLVVDAYVDAPVGTMTQDGRGKVYLSSIVLDPVIGFVGRQPTHDEIAGLHARAHDACYVANSLRGEVTVAGFAPTAHA